MKRQNQYIKNHRLSFQIAGIMLIIAVVMFGFAKNEVKEGFQ